MADKPFLVQVNKATVEPFIEKYRNDWGMPYEPGQVLPWDKCILWWGAHYKGYIRAVIGFAKADSLPTVFVFGFFGDGSIHQAKCLLALSHMFYAIEGPKQGTCRLDNVVQLKMLLKRGWKIVDYKPDVWVKGNNLLVLRKGDDG
jgi:hypothetical protein